MMERALDGDLLGVEAGLEDLVLGGFRLGRLHVRLLAGLRYGVADDVRDPLLGRAVRDRELLVVADAAIVVAQYAAGMIDEAQGFFDVALPVAGLRVILPDQAAQRGPDLLVRGGLRICRALRRASLASRRRPGGKPRPPVQEYSDRNPSVSKRS